ncbi:MAG: DHH family phosphoesterase [Oscillospiraceae bacterium]|jgi:phosphoesterase RecJ-like protein|nr:DHH family phosphoesterase [Oscillospiraceae bacterium]
MKQLTVAEVAAFLLHNDRYLILTHRRPDGDTIGSAAALCRALRALGKRACVLENPQFTEKFRPYLDGLTCEEVDENACLVAVDTAAASMLSYSANGYEGRVSLLIDHHGRNAAYAAQGIVVPTAAACGEILLDILGQMNAPIDVKTAEALYLSVSTDTGCFRFSNVTAKTLRTAAFCIDCGADAAAINQVMFLTKRMARLQLEAHLTQSTVFYAKGKVALSRIDRSIREQLGLTEDDIDDISGFGREIAGVEISVMLRDEGEYGKISVRTSPHYDASEICAKLGGGGHKAAAGATVQGGIENAMEAVLGAISAIGVEL